MTPETQAKKIKIDKLDYIKIRNYGEGTIQKKVPELVVVVMWEGKYMGKLMGDKDYLVSLVYAESCQYFIYCQR